MHKKKSLAFYLRALSDLNPQRSTRRACSVYLVLLPFPSAVVPCISGDGITLFSPLHLQHKHKIGSLEADLVKIAFKK